MIEVRNLSQSWGSFSLRDISLSVKRGEYFVILGPCGSGKTLLLETIAGLHLPRSGRILTDGQDITELSPERRQIGLVYQQYALFPHLSVVNNIAYGLRYRKLPAAQRRQRVDEMLDLLDIRYLAERRRPAGLSGGEAQKVALARALAIRPDVLLLDEPMSSLDQRARERVVDVLKSLSARLDLPVIHVTHDYTEAASLAHRVMVLNDGGEAQTGSVREVFWHPASPFVADFLGIANVIEGQCIEFDGDSAEIQIGASRLACHASVPAGAAVSVCIRPEEIRLHPLDRAARNCITGRVRDLTDRGFSVRLLVATDGPVLTVSIPSGEFAALGVTAGSEVCLELPAQNIHVMATQQSRPISVSAAAREQ